MSAFLNVICLHYYVEVLGLAIVGELYTKVHVSAKICRLQATAS